MNGPEILVEFAPELALFVPHGRRGGPSRVATDGVSTLGHVIESLGVPLTEVGGLVVDGRHAIVGGPGDSTGRRVAWYTTAPEVVDAIADLWHATVPLCRRILEPGQKPPLTERQLEVARLRERASKRLVSGW